jgi:cell division septation protein DedD
VSPPAVSAPAPAGAFVIQVGAFSDSESAEGLRARLGSEGYPVYVESSQGARGPRWRVRVGPVAHEAAARRMSERLKSEQRLPTWIQNVPR